MVVLARDLFFRSKLTALVQSAGGQVTKDEAACELAVLELGAGDAEARIRTLVARGTPVLAFGSHVSADELRAAREAGAEAVPNSAVEARLLAILGAGL